MVPAQLSFQFVDGTPNINVSKNSRKAVRSHVMKGKNRKKPMPQDPSWAPKRRDTGTSPQMQYRHVKGGDSHTYKIPSKVGGDLSLIKLSSAITDPLILETMHVLKYAFLPPELGLAPRNPPTLDWLQDEATMHFTIFFSQTYVDLISSRQQQQGQQQQPGRKTDVATSHLVRALNVIRKRLACHNSLITASNSTILAVLGLTMAATGLGDMCMALQHRKGLYNLVMLRGGLEGLDTSLGHKICRADISLSLATSTSTLFRPGSSSNPESGMPSPISITSPTPPPPTKFNPLPICHLSLFPTQLQPIISDLSTLTRSINLIAALSPPHSSASPQIKTMRGGTIVMNLDKNPSSSSKPPSSPPSSAAYSLDPSLTSDLLISVSYRLLSNLLSLPSPPSLVPLPRLASAASEERRSPHSLLDQERREQRNFVQLVSSVLLLYTTSFFAPLWRGWTPERRWVREGVVLRDLRRLLLPGREMIDSRLRLWIWVVYGCVAAGGGGVGEHGMMMSGEEEEQETRDVVVREGLRGVIKEVSLESWDEVKGLLKETGLWVDVDGFEGVGYNREGKRLVEECLSSC